MKFPSPARRLYGSLGGRLFFCALALSSVSALAETGEIYGKLPLSFELNRGQTDGTVDFLARGPGYSLFLTPQEAVFVLAQQNVRQAAGGGPAPKSIKERSAKATDTLGSPAVLRMKLSGASAKAAVRGLDELEGKVSYFIGDDPATWRANISTYSRVQYDDIYPGVDLIYYGNQRQLEYDFVIKPGSDARRIALKFDGARKVVINAAGELLIKIGEKTFRQARPSIYQRVAQGRRTVSGGYVLRSGGRVGFSVGEYDRQRPLIIDPVLVYSTYLGGSGDDRGYGIAVDSSGNAYVTGSTSSINYPTVGPIQAAGGGGDAFVTKINATGTAMVYSTYLGGSAFERGYGIAVDSSGNAYVAGSTSSSNFPKISPIQPTTGGPFVTKINASGTALVYSTGLGDQGNCAGIAVDSAGNAYITGRTTSTSFPTVNPIQGNRGDVSYADAFVSKLNASGSALVYSTYLGGDSIDYGYGIAVDTSGNAYVTGSTYSTNFPTANPFQATKGTGAASNVFVSKLNASGSTFVYSTYLGGGGSDDGYGIAIDSSGNAYLTGETQSSNFPTANPFQAALIGTSDVFVTKLNAAGSALDYSTYLGGSGLERGNAIAVDSSGNAYVTGGTGSPNFPTLNAFSAGAGKLFVTMMNASGSSPVYSALFGGGGNFEDSLGIAVDGSGNTYLTGFSFSGNFPTTSAIQSSYGGGGDVFVAKIGASHSGNATWSASPGSGDWNTATNWSPTTVPSGTLDTATFAASNQTSVTLARGITLNGITFDPGASAYTITENPTAATVALTLSGSGITNNSGIAQNFVTAAMGAGHAGTIQFTNTATAGSATVFTNNGGTVSGLNGGGTFFENTATAGSGSFNSNGATVNGAFGGFTQFNTNSTAANATFTNSGGTVSGARGGFVSFNNSATASNATVTNNGVTASGAFGSFVQFRNTSTAGSATFTNNSTSISGGNSTDTEFLDSSTAGNGHFINIASALSATNGGFTLFFNSSTAATGTFTNNGTAADGGGSGRTQFGNTSTAANGAFTNSGAGVGNNYGGSTEFYNTATAGSSTQTSNAGTVSGAYGGYSDFLNSSSAGNATLIANGGSSGANGGMIFFEETSTGGTARAQMFGNGNLDISLHGAPGLTIGSIEGTGKVFLGARNLTVGSNNLATTFSGAIQDGGYNGGTGGSFTKSGTATLTLSGPNTYIGATIVSGGVLNLTGSLANGAVSVTSNAALTDSGSIGGNVSVSGLLTGCGTIGGTLTVNIGGIVDLTGCALTVNGAITNDGLFILSAGATLAGSSSSFTNNGTLDIITAGTFNPPTGFTNNGTIIDSKVVKPLVAQKNGNSFTVTINSYTGHTYQLQKSTTPSGNSFGDIGASQQGSTNTVLTFTDSSATGTTGFYRISVNP